MNGGNGRHNFHIPSFNDASNSFGNRLHSNHSPYSFNSGPASGIDMCGSTQVEELCREAFGTDGAMNCPQSGPDAELSKICTIFEPDIVDVPPTDHSNASTPSSSTPPDNYFPSPYLQNGHVQGSYHLDSNPIPIWSPSPTAMAGLLSQSSPVWFEGGPQPFDIFQNTVVDPITHHRRESSDFMGFAGPLADEAPSMPLTSLESYEQAGAYLPPLSYSLATTPADSPSAPQTPVDGPGEGTEAGQTLSRNPFHPVIMNEQDTKDAQFPKLPNATSTPPTSVAHETDDGDALHSPVDAPAGNSGQSFAVQVDSGLPSLPFVPNPNSSSSTKKRKRPSNNQNSTKATLPSASRTQTTKDAAVPFETRETRRRCKELTIKCPAPEAESSFPFLSEMLGDRGLCKFKVIDEDGVEGVCGKPLVKDAGSVRGHFALHYDQLGYFTRRDALIKAALERGLSAEDAKKEDFRARCPWCGKEPALFGGLNRHIVDTELKINSMCCPCGGTNSRGNQKHNGKRHEDSDTHKKWIAKIMKESKEIKKDCESSKEEFVEGSSKGTKRMRRCE